MTQEDKELLLKDLCSRLPYGVICYNSSTESNFRLFDVTDADSDYPAFDYGYGELETVKPYLRPMSSMTEEENEEYIKRNLYGFHWDFVDWCNSKHLDYRGLIPKGLAIEVTKDNNPYK